MTEEIKDIHQGEEKASEPKTQMVWINGVLMGEDEARISPFDHGLLVGDGVFETLCVYDGNVFAMRRHAERLARGGKAMGIEIPSREVLQEGSEAVVRANALGHARVRITVSGGPGPLGSDKGNEGSTTVIAAAAMPAWDAAAAVATVPYARNESGALAGLKTTSYGENVVALAEVKRKGASEAIFGNTRGELCEGTGSNIFIVRDGEVLTPPLSGGCLAGVTRALAIELCEREGIPIRECVLMMTELADVEEAFLTSTTREVQAIGSIDGRSLAKVPGEVTTRLSAAFSEFVAENLDP